MIWLATVWFISLNCVRSSQTSFSVNDDLFAYPQYDIEFSPSYILEKDALLKLESSRGRHNDALSTFDDATGDEVEYEQLMMQSRRYLCAIPVVQIPLVNTTEEQPSKEEQQKELVRASDRGWQLLQDMEGKQCLYYSTGWWSYAFCYNSYVKQFHSLPPAPGGARTWPPVEDQTTPSYVLGKYRSNPQAQDTSAATDEQESTELQTRADGNYLIQRLGEGTPCDLTGKNRKVEIEFHCHPQTTDRIGWIKETTTCSYLMVIYTPRLCNDAAFLPPRDSRAHGISCQEILTISQAAHLQVNDHDPIKTEELQDNSIMVGRIQVGAMQHIGKDGKKLERGRIIMTPEEKAEVIIMQKDGQIQGLSKTKLKELDLEPKDIEDFKKQLQKIAGSKDWKIERIEDGNGQIQLLGIVSTDSDGGEDHYEAVKDEEEEEEAGSKEEFEREL